MATTKITNTAAEAKRSGTLPPVFRRAAAAGADVASSAGIEFQEAQGQHELVHSDRLPSDGRQDPILASWGLTFGEPDTDDPLFCPATLPAGWTRKGSDHAMWSYILDEKGRERISIFYKAAFYDRSAHMRPMSRYIVSRNHNVKPGIQYVVKEMEAVLFASHEIAVTEGDWTAIDLAQKVAEDECTGWLSVNRPGWDDAVKSWEIADRLHNP